MAEIPAEALDAAERAVRDGVRIRLGPNALALAQRGDPLKLSGTEAETVARLALEAGGPILLAAVRDDELAAERTRADVAEVVARDARRERDQAKAGFARVDARHQPEAIPEWVPCPQHARYRVVSRCPDCVTRPVVVCSNTTCESWPCADHLALHDETEETCTHA